MQLLEEFQKAWAHARYQPSNPDSDKSNSSEAEDSQSLDLLTENAVKGSSCSGAQIRCPYAGCSRHYTSKDALRIHYTNRTSLFLYMTNRD